MRQRSVRSGLLLVFTVLVLAGCAHQGPIPLTLTYQPPATAAPAGAPKTVVAIGVFRDGRGMPPQTLGRQRIPDGSENDYLLADTVADLVTAEVRTAFTARGFTVHQSGWDGAAGDIPAGTGLLLAGTIEELRVDSTSAPFKTQVTAVVRVQIVAADAAQGKIVRKLTINSKIENTIWPFSPAKVADALSGALSSAIDQLFIDSVLQERLR